MDTPIAIVILTKDEPKFLKATVQSILERTHYPYQLFISDNNSQSAEQKYLLQQYDQDPNIRVICNTNNRWVLGFNNAIEIAQRQKNLSRDYMVLTDGDIMVPESTDELCWLEYLKQQMDQHTCIGKLGLSLNLDSIKDNSLFQKTYQRELTYKTGPNIGESIIAPVDTTLAIYRQDIFISGAFRLLPGHASLIKPYFFTCRTLHYQAEHLGWKNYIEPTQEQLKEKIKCFTKYAGYIDSIVLNKTDIKTKNFYRFFRYWFKAYWSIKVIFYWILYVFTRFPRKLNELQVSHRN